MKDPLEKFIQNNRDEFDDYEFSSDLWDKIEEKSSEKKSKSGGAKMVPMRRLWQMAAGFALIMAATVLFLKPAGQTESVAETEEKAAESLYEIDPELAEADAYFHGQIQQKLTAFSAGGEEDLEPDFKDDFQTMDSVYRDMKEQLLQEGPNPYLIDAMIKNLQIRMEILARQEEILKMFKNEGLTKPDQTKNTHEKAI